MFSYHNYHSYCCGHGHSCCYHGYRYYGYHQISLLYCCYSRHYRYIHSGNNEATDPEDVFQQSGQINQTNCHAEPLQVFGCSQTDRWFWQWCSLLKGHIIRIWSQWSDCLLAASYKKVKLKHAGDDWRKRENPSVLMNGLYPGWLYGLSSSWRSLRMQLSAGLEPPRRD